MSKSRVNSANRALGLIEFLNSQNGSTIRQVADTLGLSRGTAYRLAQTLCESGYLRHDAETATYWLDQRVRSLADGYKLDAWVGDYAAKRLDRLCLAIKWPLKLTTRSGANTVVRYSTDLLSPYTWQPTFAGFRQPLLQTAAGRLYLALCREEQREFLLGLVANQRGKTAARDIRAFRANISKIRARQFESYLGTEISTVAVPIFWHEDVFAALVMQYYSAAVSYSKIAETYVPQLRRAADLVTADLRRNPQVLPG